MEQEKMTRSKEMAMLTVAGGLAFWLANFAISRTPIAGGFARWPDDWILRQLFTVSFF
jgi:hypothetical protein